MRIFYSDSPTNLLKTSGPFIIFKFYSLILRDLDSRRAISVLLVHGGPYRSIPLTCLTPNLLTTSSENRLVANVLLKILNNYSSSPPIPICSALKSGLNKEVLELVSSFSSFFAAGIYF